MEFSWFLARLLQFFKNSKCQQRSACFLLCYLGPSLARLSIPFLLSSKGTEWKMQKFLNPGNGCFAWTQLEKHSYFPFTSDELWYIWKYSEIKVNSSVQLPRGLCFFLRANPGMFVSDENFHEMLLLCFLPATTVLCLSALRQSDKP